MALIWLYIDLLSECQSLTTPPIHLGLKPQAIGSNPLKRVQESIEVRLVISAADRGSHHSNQYQIHPPLQRLLPLFPYSPTPYSPSNPRNNAIRHFASAFRSVRISNTRIPLSGKTSISCRRCCHDSICT
jgi:hypothetical protein